MCAKTLVNCLSQRAIDIKLAAKYASEHSREKKIRYKKMSEKFVLKILVKIIFLKTRFRPLRIFLGFWPMSG